MWTLHTMHCNTYLGIWVQILIVILYSRQSSFFNLFSNRIFSIEIRDSLCDQANRGSVTCGHPSTLPRYPRKIMDPLQSTNATSSEYPPCFVSSHQVPRPLTEDLFNIYFPEFIVSNKLALTGSDLIIDDRWINLWALHREVFSRNGSDYVCFYFLLYLHS
jgi:hypothetical protein